MLSGTRHPMTGSIPCSTLTLSGPYVDNRRGNVTVERYALDQAEIVVQIPPGVHTAGTTHRINLAGAHLTGLVDRLREVANALEACTELEVSVEGVA